MVRPALCYDGIGSHPQKPPAEAPMALKDKVAIVAFAVAVVISLVTLPSG
jgi:hypothetical protein